MNYHLVLKGCFLAISFFLCSFLYTQAQEKAFNWGIEGMAAYSLNPSKEFHAFNIGGPALQLRLSPNLKIGVGALPSFYIKEGKTGAKLGVAPRIDIKKWVLIAPFYHFESMDSWVGSVGFGYKF